MRTYSLAVLNNRDEIIDEGLYNLELVTGATGNGFKLDVSVIESDLENVITKVVQEKQDIKFTVQQVGASYQKANVLASWIQKYSKPEYTMVLRYNDGVNTRMCEGRVISLTKDEQSHIGVLPQVLTFRQTTPFFLQRKNQISIITSAVGKRYPFKYPYRYGAKSIQNNIIENEYLTEVPLILTINGAITNPEIKLIDEDGVVYNTVKIDDIIFDNEKLIINSAQRKIIKVFEDGREDDWSNKVVAGSDSFLRAGSGKSTLTINIGNENFNLIGSWRQYLL